MALADDEPSPATDPPLDASLLQEQTRITTEGPESEG